jgi:hypothetical protein
MFGTTADLTNCTNLIALWRRDEVTRPTGGLQSPVCCSLAAHGAISPALGLFIRIASMDPAGAESSPAPISRSPLACTYATEGRDAGRKQVDLFDGSVR